MMSATHLKEERGLSPRTFDTLLAWLDPDRLKAGEKYERIRCTLIAIFESRGCPNADELADVAIDRVAGKIHDLVNTYVGKPELYFYGVANKIYLEYLRRRPEPPFPAPCDSQEQTEKQLNCLEQCMEHLTSTNRSLITEYFLDNQHSRVETRRRMAERLGIAPNALRIRIHRIKEHLGRCITECLLRKEEE
jgi:DNA-directed RNA polymerase specialized sigma24 family protein